MLNLINLGFHYPEKIVLHAVDLNLPPGCIMHLRGDNGAGKTTLLKLIAGILQPSDGDIHYAGKPISGNLAEYQHNIRYVGHKTGISPVLSVAENCQFDLNYLNKQLSLDNLLEQFDLLPYKHTPCGLLSAGQRRRVGLTRLLMSQAALWLLDEPLVALDQKNVEQLIDVIKQHAQQGGSVILTSHQPIPQLSHHVQEYWLR